MKTKKVILCWSTCQEAKEQIGNYFRISPGQIFLRDEIICKKKVMSCLFDIVSHIISISFFLLVSKSIIFLTYMIKYIDQHTRKKFQRTNEQKKDDRCSKERKLIRCLHCKRMKKKRTAVLVVRILECVHSLYSLIS